MTWLLMEDWCMVQPETDVIFIILYIYILNKGQVWYIMSFVQHMYLFLFRKYEVTKLPVMTLC